MVRARSNTRGEIIDVAMRRFVDQGYDGTSLREIAEDIGVTKAALYYHFRTKDEIVAAAFDAHVHRIDELVETIESMPSGDARDEELLSSLEELFAGESGLVMRFGQVNQAVMSREGFGARNLEAVTRLMSGLAHGEPDVDSRLRGILALGAIVLGTMDHAAEDTLAIGGSAEERRGAARRIAHELIAGVRG